MLKDIHTSLASFIELLQQDELFLLNLTQVQVNRNFSKFVSTQASSTHSCRHVDSDQFEFAQVHFAPSSGNSITAQVDINIGTCCILEHVL